jgi:putative DNA primase/helicase
MSHVEESLVIDLRELGLTGFQITAALKPRTDVGNAEFLAETVGQEKIRFDHEQGEWFGFINHRWFLIPATRVGSLAIQTVRARYDTGREIKERTAEGEKLHEFGCTLMAFARQCESAHKIEAVIRVARTLDEFDANNLKTDDAEMLWNPYQHLLGVPNGVVDLRTGELRAGEPEDRITKQTAIPYDPDAKCARWDRFIEEVLPDPFTRCWRCRFTGYSVTGGIGEEKLVFDVGEGSNGKSTYYGFIRRVLGEYVTVINSSILLATRRGAHTTEMTEAEGRRQVQVLELTAGAGLNEERVKSLVSRDPITARKMRRDSRTFIPTHKLWGGTNNLPHVEDPTKGFWRRMKVVPWTEEFPVSDVLDKELEQELPGILRWLVDQAREYYAHGLGVESDQMLKATGEYRDLEDELLDYSRARLVETEGAFLSSAEAFKDYRNWATWNSIPTQDQISHAKFGRLMGKRYTSTTERINGKQVRGYRGVRLELTAIGDTLPLAPLRSEADMQQ